MANTNGIDRFSLWSDFFDLVTVFLIFKLLIAMYFGSDH